MSPALVPEPAPDSVPETAAVAKVVPRTVLDASDISRALTRIAHEILERNRGADPVVLLGIPTRGVGLARRISDRIAAVEGQSVPTGSLDVTMYRDDIGLKPARALEHTDIPPGGIDGKVVVLVDDVLFSGRTIRAALDAIGDIEQAQSGAAGGAGRPRSPRTPDPRGLRRQEPAHLAGRAGHRPPHRVRRHRRRPDRRQDHNVRRTEGYSPQFFGRKPEGDAVMRHLLSAGDLSRDDANLILDTAEEMRALADRPIKKLPALRGRTVVNLFFEDSTRTGSRSRRRPSGCRPT